MAIPGKVMSANPWLVCNNSSISSSSTSVAVLLTWKKRMPCLFLKVNCTPLQQNIEAQQHEEDELQLQHVDENTDAEDVGIMCEACNSKGWLLCHFCKGQKTNVKTENNRIYRRCPSCKTTGYVLCSKCKVFKCVTFPDYSDGEL